MTPERYKEVGRLYNEALKLTPAERTAYLAEVCSGDDALRLEVESLLAYEAHDETLIDQPALAAVDPTFVQNAKSPDRSLVWKSIGHFRILSLLGTGALVLSRNHNQGWPMGMTPEWDGSTSVQ